MPAGRGAQPQPQMMLVTFIEIVTHFEGIQKIAS